MIRLLSSAAVLNVSLQTERQMHNNGLHPSTSTLPRDLIGEDVKACFAMAHLQLSHTPFVLEKNGSISCFPNVPSSYEQFGIHGNLAEDQ